MILNKQKVLPKEFICPISLAVMKDPVMTADGHTFQRSAINDWLQKGKKTNPLTNRKLQNCQLAPNRALKSMIDSHIIKGIFQKDSIQEDNTQKCNELKSSVQKQSNVSKVPQAPKQRVKPLRSEVPVHSEVSKCSEVQKSSQVSKCSGIPKHSQMPIRSQIPIISEIISQKQHQISPNQINQENLNQIKQNTPKSIDEVLGNFEKQWNQFQNRTLEWLRNFKNKQKSFPQTKQTLQGYYKGTVQVNGRHGQGIMIYKQGNVQFGQWKNDLLDGKGQKYFKDIRMTYSGFFRKGKYHGLGQISDPVKCTVFYRGNWQHGKKSGIGIENDLTERKIYSGQWYKDQKHGVGKEKNSLGDIYEGMWKNGIKQGRGIKKKSNGEVTYEFWKHGKEWGSQKRYKACINKGKLKKQQPCSQCNIF